MRSPVSWELSGAGGGNDILFSFTELVPLLLGWNPQLSIATRIEDWVKIKDDINLIIHVFNAIYIQYYNFNICNKPVICDIYINYMKSI